MQNLSLNQKILSIAAVLLVITTMGILTYQLQRQQDPRSKATGETAKLLFDPTTSSPNSNTNFTTKISIDSTTLPITGVDLTFTLDTNSVEFISFTPANILNSKLINKFDTTTSEFRFAAVDTSTNAITGVTELGTLTLRAKSGTGQLTLTTSQVTASGHTSAIPLTIPTPRTYTINSTTAPTSTPIPPSDNPRISFTIFLNGIGKAGDSTKPVSNVAKPPARLERDIEVVLTKSGGAPTTFPGKITYNETEGNFKGLIDTGPTFPEGQYDVEVKIPYYIEEASAPHTITLARQTTTPAPVMRFKTGDVNNDGQLDTLDYNFILDCYSDLHPAKACVDAQKQLISDLNDDARVDIVDYNLFLRETKPQ
jgi:hypothetical protein